MRREDVDELWGAASNPWIWELAHGPRSLVEMREYVEQALEPHSESFVIRLLDGRLLGSTRLKRIDRVAKCCELGNTWLVPDQWRTGTNMESKRLLLSYAFETVGMYRVELRAGAQNWRSRKSLLRLGATEEGTLRSVQLLPSGERRDHVIFSILLPEWPGIKSRL